VCRRFERGGPKILYDNRRIAPQACDCVKKSEHVVRQLIIVPNQHTSATPLVEIGVSRHSTVPYNCARYCARGGAGSAFDCCDPVEIGSAG